ncbi:MAG: hypothetical protein ABSD38_07645 [Syntrophorhabdales bacterium]|jgi:hypothetical protein
MKMILAAMIFAVMVGLILTVVGLTTSHAAGCTCTSLGYPGASSIEVSGVNDADVSPR